MPPPPAPQRRWQERRLKENAKIKANHMGFRRSCQPVCFFIKAQIEIANKVKIKIKVGIRFLRYAPTDVNSITFVSIGEFARRPLAEPRITSVSRKIIFILIPFLTAERFALELPGVFMPVHGPSACYS